jgi:trk system potassium uptake protein TrkH
MTQHSGSLLKYPARVSFVWYLSAIVLGGVILNQPFCRYESVEPISFVDALFTSTSATCVTGLSVRSTGNAFNFTGQAVILALVQLGGIGIITVTTFAMVQMGNRASLRQRTVIVETLGVSDRADLRSILKNIIWATLFFEVAGATMLTLRFWLGYGMPLATAVWNGVFHAVSAFCNAGFGLLDDNLMRYQKDPVVNFTICGLIIIGGIGYPVILDLNRNWQRRNRGWDYLTLHSKVMILGTAAILTLSVVGFLLLEDDGVLKGMSWWECGLVSFFHAVTCRTAGFNTIDVAKLSDATLFLSILLMVIGAGPCSTAGGFKVSTLSVLLLHAWSRFRGATRINAFRRTIPSELAGRATALAMLFGVVIVIMLTIMLVVEQNGLGTQNAPRHFLNVLFEVASALGTVGLSTGITPALSDLGKLVIVAVMFMGRLGPISLFVAISLPDKAKTLEFYNEEPLLG